MIGVYTTNAASRNQAGHPSRGIESFAPAVRLQKRVSRRTSGARFGDSVTDKVGSLERARCRTLLELDGAEGAGAVVEVSADDVEPGKLSGGPIGTEAHRHSASLVVVEEIGQERDFEAVGGDVDEAADEDLSGVGIDSAAAVGIGRLTAKIAGRARVAISWNRSRRTTA